MPQRSVARRDWTSMVRIAHADRMHWNAPLARRRNPAAPFFVPGRIVAVGHQDDILEPAKSVVVRGLHGLANARADARAGVAAFRPQFLGRFSHVQRLQDLAEMVVVM